MRAHLRYLKYVILHKLYVFAGGLAIATKFGRSESWPRLLWRYLIHDWTKFLPSEWTPYVETFYGEQEEAWIERRTAELMTDPEFAVAMTQEEEDRKRASLARAKATTLWAEEKKRRQAAFNRAWLFHQNRNRHHWQHWILRLDVGKEVTLVPEAQYVDEMVADWIGAGTKILEGPTLSECVALTVSWYMQNRTIIQLRDLPRARVESILHTLSAEYGLLDLAFQVRQAALARQSITIAQPS